ncbi:isoleucine--tRNA ligase [Dehalococcoidia bacterium]|nr:isoleucine--tRNA ligase [Dehalococcoidia bacterium]
MFKSVDSKVNFPELERTILKWWESNEIPKKYMSRNEYSEKRYSFIDGPITANNPMGVHHAWGRSYKDLFARFRTMQGYKQRYQNGFDGQGLWIEVEVEKELGFSSKMDIESYGVDKFVTLCKERVQRFSDVITNQSKQLAYWMHWDNSYHTMADDNNYTIWHFLKTCNERGLIYEGTDVMPWCPRCSTGLSEHEIVTEGYVEIVHPGLFVKFPVTDSGTRRTPNESILVWTTTPWTLTSNCAAAVNPEMHYVKVSQKEEFYYLAKSRITSLSGEYEIVEEFKGTELIGLCYDGPFDELPAQRDVEHRILAWDEVSEGEGTGIVHIAPGAGKEDFALGKREGISTIAPLNDQGDFIEGFDWLTGLNVYDVNDRIYENLKEKGIFYRLEKYRHRYPHCWRCGSELVFRLVDEWFIRMDPLRESLARVTQNINWIPEFGMKRELDWIRNMDDWMISKKRYYGLALPIYSCDCGNFEVIGSEDELKDRSIEGWDEFEGNSPHRPWIDSVKIACSKCGTKIGRILDVGNPWLDAGIVSFSTLKFREDKDYWNDWFPADWISESFPGQYRNWFYSLLVMSTVLVDSEPCKNIFSYALMRDENGEDMHKSKGNAIWFEDAAEKMGVDAMRWQFARQNPAANLNFGFGTADEVRRQFLIPLWNVYSFFVIYANIDEFDPRAEIPLISERTELDRWILSELNSLTGEVTKALESFDPENVTREVEQFTEYLSNWYIRRSRRRFWKSGLLSDSSEDSNHDKLSAYSTLYETLVTLTKLLAPVVPFITESIYQNLVTSQALGKESVHLEEYPVTDRNIVERELSERTRLAMRLSSMGRSARSKAGIKVRQPLEHIYVHTRTVNELGMLPLIEDQLLDELNVKHVTPVADAAEIVSFQIQPNLPVLGPRYGKKLGAIRSALELADPSDIKVLVDAGHNIELGEFTLEPGEILISAIELDGVSSVIDSGYAVGISSDISPELREEGTARELVHRIQNMRRSAGFEISDHINLWISGSDELSDIVEKHFTYFKEETLAENISSRDIPVDCYIENHDLDGKKATVAVMKM